MTILDIWNRALAELGHDRAIPSEDSDWTEAQRCRLAWDGARKAILSAHDWNWLAQETPLLEGCHHSCNPCGPSEYAFPRPTDQLRIISIKNVVGRRVTYRAANGMILTQCPAIRIRYVPDNLNPDEWPQAIQDAVTYELAARIAMPMSASAEKMAAMKQMAITCRSEAIYFDASENKTAGSPPDKYIRARR